MKRIPLMIGAIIAVLLAFVSIPVFGQTTTIRGIIIDNACAGGHKADLANFIKTHTKECLLMPSCEASGYNIFSEGKLYKLDKDSNAKIAAFLKQNSSTPNVVVKGKISKDMLKVVSVENQ